MKMSKNHKILLTSWNIARSMKFCWRHENEQEPRNFADFIKWARTMNFCWLHKMSKNREFLLTAEKKQNHEIFPTSWEWAKTSWKWAKTTKFCQLHKNEQKPWNFSDFMKISISHMILPTSGKWAKTMQCCQLHKNE